MSEEGFKTVVTLRLAPVLPIPLGAYNYGASAINMPRLRERKGLLALPSLLRRESHEHMRYRAKCGSRCRFAMYAPSVNYAGIANQDGITRFVNLSLR